MEELIGRKLGQYQIEAKIGSGGMASIFKAYQSSLERYVAIKVLPPSLASQNPIFTQRFQREAKSIARLHHPNILPVYDFGVDSDYTYIVMRYVMGAQTLGQIMSYSFNNERIIHFISQIANALTYSHQQGVIHRDVKPSNILLDGEWALLSDFGLARVEEAVSQLTDSGVGIGTPAYMSPEQARGEGVDYRTDIYSLGVIVYEMLTHTIPHNAPTSVGILMKRMTQPPPSPRTINPAISADVEQVILRALSVIPAARYEQATDYADDLKKAMLNGSYQTYPVILPDKKTITFDPASVVRSLAEENMPAPKKPYYLRRPVWLAGLAVGISLAVLAWWSSIFRPLLPPQNSTSPTALPAAVVPTPTLTPSLTSTSPPPPATATPSASPSPTSLPADTPAPVVVVVTATATNTPTSTPDVPTASRTATPSPTSGLTAGAFTLLNPVSLNQPTYGPTIFEWEWRGSLPPGFGFEVRVWREGEPPAGVHDAVLDNQAGRIEKVGENHYRLQVDIHQAAGVRQRTGEYLWTVVLVQISPDYADSGLQAEPARLRFEAGGGKGNDGDGGGSGGSGIS
jgi:serine/threonine protein kinase